MVFGTFSVPKVASGSAVDQSVNHHPGSSVREIKHYCSSAHSPHPQPFSPCPGRREPLSGSPLPFRERGRGEGRSLIAQKFSQGLNYLQKNQSARSLKLRGSENNFYKVLRGASLDFSDLSGSCVDIIGGCKRWAPRGPHRGAGGGWARRFKTYVEQKLQTYRAYAAEAISDCSNRRVI